MTHPFPKARTAVLAAGAVLAAAAAGCGKTSSSGPSSGTVTYAQVAPIFAANCTRCHSSTLAGGARAGAPASVNYDTYRSASTWASAGLAAVQSGLMPVDNPGAVSDAETCTLQAWVDQGTKP